MTIKVVDIIVERRGKILLVKRGDFWILPGGEIEPGECEQSCLEEVVSKDRLGGHKFDRFRSRFVLG